MPCLENMHHILKHVLVSLARTEIAFKSHSSSLSHVAHLREKADYHVWENNY